MCANYVPVTHGDELLAFFGVQRDFAGEVPPELWPTGLAPFVRLVQGERAAAPGRFGLLPPWNRDVRFGTKTYNARSETLHLLPSFRDSWRQGLRCVVPARAVYEPRYDEEGRSERWRIEREDGRPFGIAGLYTAWLEGREERFSFTMVTVNCDGHPFYAQFHQPGKEKRMPVFLEPEDYDAWMASPLKEAPAFFRAWPGPFRGVPDPLPARTPRAPRAAAPPPAPPAPRPTRPPEPPEPPGAPAPPVQPDLF